MAEKKTTTTKKTTTKKKTTSSIAVKAEAEVKAEEIKTEVAKVAPKEERICAVCGNVVAKGTGFALGNGVWVCSNSCLARYAQTHREHKFG